MIHRPTNPRKLKRFLENEAHAREARFWVGKIKTADRSLLHDQPVNGAARSATLRSKGEPKPERSVFVYLIRFRSIMNPHYSFLKIGITNNMSERFELDSYRFKKQVLDSVGKMLRREALDVEVRLHRMFAERSHRPTMNLLSKGNSECFEDDASIIAATTNLFSLLRQELAAIA